MTVFGPYGYLAVSLFVLLGGLCLGSFLNVCIWRIPRGESIAWPGSHCPKCGHPIAWFDNIPLVSWVALGGKCRHCREPISARYFTVELLTGTLFTWIWLRHGATALTPLHCLFTGALVFASFVDFDHLILPDRVTIGGMVAGPVLSVLWPELQGEAAWPGALVSSLAGLGAGFGLLWLVGVAGKAILKRDAMGFGDVKLLGAIGACLGWRAVLFCVLVSSLSGTLAGLGMVAAGRKDLQGRIPYGPHLALAAVLWMLYGPAWVAAYWRWATGGL